MSYFNVVIYTDVSGREPDIQVGVYRVIESRSIGSVVVSSLASEWQIV